MEIVGEEAKRDLGRPWLKGREMEWRQINDEIAKLREEYNEARRELINGRAREGEERGEEEGGRNVMRAKTKCRKAEQRKKRLLRRWEQECWEEIAERANQEQNVRGHR